MKPLHELTRAYSTGTWAETERKSGLLELHYRLPHAQAMYH